MKKVLVLACLMLSSVAFIPSNVCASNSGDGGPLDEVLIFYDQIKAIKVIGWHISPQSGHEYTIYEATTRSGKIINYAIDEMERVFYDLYNLP